ncbi:MAG: N-acetyltransferase [Parasphingorhabdus sp.]|nr:N-acetyltransferase [Parasphingorhabdus sp.]
MSDSNIVITPVKTKADRNAFIDLPYRLYASNPNWVPPLKSEVASLLTPGENPWFEHAEAQLFLARRNGRIAGRISAHLDHLALAQPPEQGMGPGVGNWGLFEAEDEATAHALLDTAAQWLRDRNMTRMLGPISLSMWDEPGLLVQGFDAPPVVMMGFNAAAYQGWIETAGHQGVEDLYTYGIQIDQPMPALANRIVAMGEKSGRIRIRNVDKKRFDAEAALIIGILNAAWCSNWGFVPFTESEIAYAGKKLKPLVYEDLIRVAEIDGRPVAFMMTLPDLNERLINYGGKLFPFNWAKLLWWLRAPKVRTMRVPLMGVIPELQGSRVASQLALMLIEFIRRDAVAKYGASRGDFGWVLASNGPMRSVGEAVGGEVNKIYRIYEKTL